MSSEEAREQLEDAYLSVYWEPDVSLGDPRSPGARGRGALLLRALDATRDADWKERRGSAGTAPARQASNAEALVAVAEAALAHPQESAWRRALPGGRERRRAVLSHDGEGGCEPQDGSALSPETARRLACDASSRA